DYRNALYFVPGIVRGDRVDSNTVICVLTIRRTPAGAGSTQLFVGQLAIVRVQIEINRCSQVAMQDDRDAAQNRRVDALSQIPRNRKNLFIVTGQADPPFPELATTTLAERERHCRIIPKDQARYASHKNRQ